MKIKILSVVMAFAMLAAIPTSYAAAAEETATAAATTPSTTASSQSTTKADEEAKQQAQKTLEEQMAELEKNRQEAEAKLAELGEDSKVTEEYINTLDQKIGYINEQLTLLEQENTDIQAEIDKLTPDMEENEKQLESLSAEVEAAQEEIKKLEDKFQSVYEAYCVRLRVMYISGDYNILSALLSCKDISSFLTRYEMIKSVSKSDTELLKEVNEKTEEIITKKDGLDEKVAEYTEIKEKYDAQQAELVEKQNKIEQNSQTITENKVSLATDRAESDSLLAQLNQQNQQYTEYKYEDEELMDAVEQEIQDLISGIKSPDEVTTATRSEKTTGSSDTGGKADVFSNNNAVLNMLYPVPGCYSVSAGFPNYSNGSYHGGIDFPCSTGSSVVAAQDGIVVTVKRLDYSYGYYVMIYHGTDTKGRKVVTLYAHNSSILVSTGQSVKRGQQIARSGSTGNSTGPHCHFEVRFDGTRVNPTYYLSRS